MVDRRWRPSLQRRFWRIRRDARNTAHTLNRTGRQLVERLAYRSREVGAVALLATGLFGGLVIEHWRSRHPAAAERLEAEPVRATREGSQAATRPRPRRVFAPSCQEPGIRTSATGPAPTGSIRRLDLNRATPGELAHLARIPWRLATRIVAARDAVEDSGAPPSEAAPDGAPATEPPAASSTPDLEETAPDAEP